MLFAVRFAEHWELPGASFTRYSTQGGRGKLEYDVEDVSRQLSVRIGEASWPLTEMLRQC